MAFNSETESPLPFPIIADDKRELSVQLGMLDPDERDKDGIPLTARCVRNLLFYIRIPMASAAVLDMFCITALHRHLAVKKAGGCNQRKFYFSFHDPE